jgi:hypothetical protein
MPSLNHATTSAQARRGDSDFNSLLFSQIPFAGLGIINKINGATSEIARAKQKYAVVLET